jgi:hypothetical protein
MRQKKEAPSHSGGKEIPPDTQWRITGGYELPGSLLLADINVFGSAVPQFRLLPHGSNPLSGPEGHGKNGQHRVEATVGHMYRAIRHIEVVMAVDAAPAINNR